MFHQSSAEKTKIIDQYIFVTIMFVVFADLHNLK